jgi:formate-dependent nitrite reductase membrane component NrfD
MSAPSLIERERTYDRFAPHLVVQPHWRGPHALWFWAMGLGAGTFMVRHVFSLADTGTVLGLSLLDVIGLVLVAIGGLILILDLGRPERVLKALKRPDRSWIARGAIADFVFLIVGAIYVLPGWFPGLPWTDAPFLQANLAAQVMIGICFVAAALIIAYPGMVLYESLSIRLWHSALVPAQFIAHALASSLGLTLLVLALGGRLAGAQTALAVGFLVALVATLGLTHMYVVERAHEHSPAARAGLQRLLHGAMAGHFWTSVLAGFGVPTVLTLIALAAPGAGPALLATGGALSVLGSLQFRYAQLCSGVKVSPLG